MVNMPMLLVVRDGKNYEAWVVVGVGPGETR